MLNEDKMEMNEDVAAACTQQERESFGVRCGDGVSCVM